MRLKSDTFQKFDIRLVLLLGQSISLGTLLSLLIIAASALFLTRFGSQNLPYVYIVVAILGSLVFYSYAELQRRISLPSLSKSTLIVIASFFLILWLGLTLTNAGWLTFLLMVSFSLIIQMGFVLLGNQAGRLFDVREIKAKFPRVVAGFAIGFLLGGVIAAQIIGVIGRAENLLLLVVFFSLTMLVFLLFTDRRYHYQLRQVETSHRQKSSKPLWRLLAKRFVLLIVLYQMLSAMVSQLLDFMLFDQAASRYADSLGLAEFIGNYTVVVNVSDILFLALFAGLLLSRYGLKFGMSANPVLDVLILVAEVSVGLALGVNSVLFFTLVMAARIVDITLTDGTTRGSVNTAYQALPAEERVTVQTGVEGIGVPLAMGLTGVILLVFNNISGLTSLHVAIFTLVASVIWTASALIAYRGYAGSLVRALKRRALNPAELTLKDTTSLAVVQGFLVSNNIREVRLALDLLHDAGNESLDETLVKLTGSGESAIRIEAMRRIQERKIAQALPAINERLKLEIEPQALSATLLTYCSLVGGDSVEFVRSYLDSDNREILYGAVVGLLRYGENHGITAARNKLADLESSLVPANRRLAARIIGSVGSNDYYQPIATLLLDVKPGVRRSALTAAGQLRNPELLPIIINNLDQPNTRSAAMNALTPYGEEILPYVERALSGESEFEPWQTIRLIRAASQVKSEKAVYLLHVYIDQTYGVIRTALLHALSSSDFQASVEQVPGIKAALVEEAVEATRLLIVSTELGELEPAKSLQRAMADELESIKQRICYLLTFLGERPAILRAFERLSSGSGAQQSLALETLDVMLSADIKKIVLPLVDPRLALEQRLHQLSGFSSGKNKEISARLAEIIDGEEKVWRHFWIRSCAIYTAVALGLNHLSASIESSISAPEPPLRETAIWALHKLDRRRFENVIATMLADPDSSVARLSTALVAREV